MEESACVEQEKAWNWWCSLFGNTARALPKLYGKNFLRFLNTGSRGRSLPSLDGEKQESKSAVAVLGREKGNISCRSTSLPRNTAVVDYSQVNQTSYENTVLIDVVLVSEGRGLSQTVAGTGRRGRVREGSTKKTVPCELTTAVIDS